MNTNLSIITTVCSIVSILSPCRVCGALLPADSFSAQLDGRRTICRECDASEYVLRSLSRRGISQPVFDLLLASQGAHCFFCDSVVSTVSGHRLSIDHAHDRDCGHKAGKDACAVCIRGLVCQAANSSLTMWEEEALARVLTGEATAHDVRVLEYVAGAPLLAMAAADSDVVDVVVDVVVSVPAARSTRITLAISIAAAMTASVGVLAGCASPVVKTPAPAHSASIINPNTGLDVFTAGEAGTYQ